MTNNIQTCCAFILIVGTIQIVRDFKHKMGEPAAIGGVNLLADKILKMVG
jgi:hypothetical protein